MFSCNQQSTSTANNNPPNRRSGWHHKVINKLSCKLQMWQIMNRPSWRRFIGCQQLHIAGLITACWLVKFYLLYLTTCFLCSRMISVQSSADTQTQLTLARHWHWFTQTDKILNMTPVQTRIFTATVNLALNWDTIINVVDKLINIKVVFFILNHQTDLPVDIFGVTVCAQSQ